MLVKEVMSTNPISLREENTIREASLLMFNHNVGSIPIVNNSNEIIGMVTDRDIVLRSIADEISSSNPVSKIMSDRIVTIDQNKTVDEALEIMSEHRVRRIPVTENKKFVGMLTIFDVASFDDYMFEIADAMCEIQKEK